MTKKDNIAVIGVGFAGLSAADHMRSGAGSTIVADNVAADQLLNYLKN